MKILKMLPKPMDEMVMKIIQCQTADINIQNRMISGCTLNEIPCLVYLLGLKVIPDLKWILYFHAMTKDARRMVCFL